MVTSGTPGPKKKQLKKSPPERVEKVVQVVTVPASELKNYVPNGTLPHSTTGSPQLKEGTLKRIIHTDNTSTTSLMKSPMIKQKFEHVSVVSASPAVSLSRITQSPKLVRKDGIEIHPRLLNGKLIIFCFFCLFSFVSDVFSFNCLFGFSCWCELSV